MLDAVKAYKKALMPSQTWRANVTTASVALTVWCGILHALPAKPYYMNLLIRTFMGMRCYMLPHDPQSQSHTDVAPKLLLELLAYLILSF
jgi:hypothetical protein